MKTQELGSGWSIVSAIVIMAALGALAGLLGCSPAPTSLIDGEWSFEFDGAVQCRTGGAPGGTLVVYEGAGGMLSGEYDVCNRASAAKDLGGRINGQRFELTMFGGAINVVNGSANPDALAGDVVGLGEGITFRAQRAGARTGKPGTAP